MLKKSVSSSVGKLVDPKDYKQLGVQRESLL
jgi:hypothetical protein